MSVFTKVLLTGSTGGCPINITSISSPGDIIHTSEISSSIIDEVWLYATNTSVAQTTLIIEYGNVSSPGNLIKLPIPAQSGLSIVLPGLILSGDNTSGKTIRAYSLTSGVINIVGYINRIS